MCSLGATISGQQQSISINGLVADQYGAPLEGVVVTSEDGQSIAMTNTNGEFLLLVNEKDKFVIFSLIGYTRQKIEIGGQERMDVKLEADVHKLEEVVHMGYTSQLRKDISGAVSTVSGTELEKSPVALLGQTLAGRLSGLTSMETFSELSRANTSFYVRGISAARGASPLVMIDGIICAYNSSQTLEYISASEIESISVLKDASTQALYGIQGANGLIVVTTKRGSAGGLKIKTRFDQSVQQVTTQPTFYNSADYAELRNQAAYNDGLGQNYLFSETQIANYRSGENRDLYPNNNWYDKYMKDFASMQRVGIDVSGGNNKVQFFSNINVMHQGGQFKTDQDEYNSNANNIWINYRSNVDMMLNKYLKAYVRLSGNVKRERTPGSGNAAIYSSLFQMPSTVYGPITPQVLDSEGNILDEGGKVITTERVTSPTYGMLNRSGYYRHTVTNITSQFGLDLDMSFLTKGLSLNGVMAYQTNAVGSLGTTQDYERWIRTDDPSVLEFIKKGSQVDSPLAYSKSHSFYYHLTYNMAMNYQRDFGKHHITGMGYMFYQNLTKTDTSSPWCLPYNRVSSGIEATYGYNNRYLAKFDMGYSGSEQYARDSRYTLTPAVSVAWVASNEEFLKETDWLSNLKLRASYGKTANDQSGLARYSYLDNVSVTGGGSIGYLQYNITEGTVGNPKIEAEASTKQNFGLDLGLFNSVSVSVDVFKERMENMVVSAYSTIPLYQGVPLTNYPKTNTGTFENQGYDISVNYFKSINKDLSVSVGGLFSYAKNTIINWNEAEKTEDYAYRKREEGYSYGQSFGYLVDYSNGNGFFNSQSEINSSNLQYDFGDPRVGDLMYQDLTDDGIIDERDMAPIGKGAIPRITYALSGGLNYKSFGFSLLFQGIGDYSSIYSGIGVYETSYDGIFGALHQNAWTEERYQNGEEITSPALSLTKSVSHESNDYYNYDRSFVRLKNAELTYKLPDRLTKLISASSASLILSGQNLITWDKMKSDDFGPEGSYSSFPVYRVYNIGVRVKF
jgi:TonB-linked SusC/RagA family outer membrane protein